MAHFSLLSETHTTKSSTDSLFDFMGDFHNFKHLLPEDKIDNFECTSEQCSFSIKGLTALTIKIKEKHPKSKITFETSGLAKFVFTLHIHLLQNQTTNVQLEAIVLINSVNGFSAITFINGFISPSNCTLAV